MPAFSQRARDDAGVVGSTQAANSVQAASGAPVVNVPSPRALASVIGVSVMVPVDDIGDFTQAMLSFRHARDDWSDDEWRRFVAAEAEVHWAGCVLDGARGIAKQPEPQPPQTRGQQVAPQLTQAKGQPVAPQPPRAKKRRKVALVVEGVSLGSGTFGQVVKGTYHGSPCAVKYKHAGGPARQDNEISILKHLSAGGGALNKVVTLLAWDVHSDMLRLVFPLYDMNLREWIVEQHEAASGAESVRAIAEDLCVAVAYVHSQRILHRDLKPANVLLTKPDAQAARRPVLADFGSARIMAAPVARAQEMAASGARGYAMTRRVATPGYVSPEALLPPHFYSYPSDVWALGIVLLEVEHGKQMCCVAQRAPDYVQLLAAWRLRQAGDLSRSSPNFINRAEKMLLQRYYAAKLQKRLNVWTTCEYGPMFRLLTTKCVEFDPCQRARASDLLVGCSRRRRQPVAPGAASGAGVASALGPRASDVLETVAV